MDVSGMDMKAVNILYGQKVTRNFGKVKSKPI